MASNSKELPGNWFLSSSGTCSSPPDTTATDSNLTSTGAFAGFLILALAVTTFSGICNFYSTNTATREKKLFEHGLLRQSVIDVAASFVAPVVALTAFKQDDDVYTWHSFHIMMWTLLFGFRPGAIMGLAQVFGGDISAASAIGQMAPECLFLIVGCAGVLMAENGTVVPVAYGTYRAAVFVGVGLVIAHLALLLVMYSIYAANRPPEDRRGGVSYEELYEVLMGGGARFAIFVLGLLSLTGSLVLMIVASKMCGRLTGFIEAMCQVVQAVLSLLLAIWSNSKEEKGRSGGTRGNAANNASNYYPNYGRY